MTDLLTTKEQREANDDMIEGYNDGAKASEAEFPERLSNRGAAYRHGWLNGRDDRVGRPRASAETLREKAQSAMQEDAPYDHS